MILFKYYYILEKLILKKGESCLAYFKNIIIRQIKHICYSSVKKKSITGFTLLEVLIVSTLFIILLLFALPNARNIYSKMKTEEQVEDIVTFFNYAQERTIQELQPKIVVRVYADEKKLTLRYLAEEEILDELILPQEYIIETETKRITFDSFGKIYIADEQEEVYLMNASIDIFDEEDRHYKIKIYNTGYIGYKREK